MSKFNMYNPGLTRDDLIAMKKFCEIFESLKEKYENYQNKLNQIEIIKNDKTKIFEQMKQTNNQNELKNLNEEYDEKNKKYEDLESRVKFIQDKGISKILDELCNKFIIGRYIRNDENNTYRPAEINESGETYQQMYKKLNDIMNSYYKIDEIKNKKGILSRISAIVFSNNINRKEYEKNINFYKNSKYIISKTIKNYEPVIIETLQKMQETIDVKVNDQEVTENTNNINQQTEINNQEVTKNKNNKNQRVEMYEKAKKYYIAKAYIAYTTNVNEEQEKQFTKTA